MLKFEQINQDIATLPETDQQLVIDFIEILKKRQVSQSSIEQSLESKNNSFDRRAFLKLPIAERQRILSEQAEAMVEHYQKDTSWQEWVNFDNCCRY